jgi:hypothetical protein
MSVRSKLLALSYSLSHSLVAAAMLMRTAMGIGLMLHAGAERMWATLLQRPLRSGLN